LWWRAFPQNLDNKAVCLNSTNLRRVCGLSRTLSGKKRERYLNENVEGWKKSSDPELSGILSGMTDVCHMKYQIVCSGTNPTLTKPANTAAMPTFTLQLEPFSRWVKIPTWYLRRMSIFPYGKCLIYTQYTELLNKLPKWMLKTGEFIPNHLISDNLSNEECCSIHAKARQHQVLKQEHTKTLRMWTCPGEINKILSIEISLAIIGKTREDRTLTAPKGSRIS